MTPKEWMLAGLRASLMALEQMPEDEVRESFTGGYRNVDVQAWMVLEMTKEMIRHREECISIAEEYQRRLADEPNTESGPE